MTDAVATPEATQEVANPETAPEEQKAAAPDAATEANQKEEKTQAEEKTYSQKEFDEATAKARKKAEAIAERRALKVYAEKLESMQKAPAPEVKKVDVQSGKPKMSDYTNAEEYVEALTEYKLQEREEKARVEQEERSKEVTRGKVQSIFDEAEKMQGFDRADFDALPISEATAFAIMDSDMAPKLMLHFTQNPEEAERIHALSPARQAAEIGKLEVKLSEAKQVKVSGAPPPIKPVGNRGGAVGGNLEDMTMEQYEAYRRKQQPRWARRS